MTPFEFQLYVARLAMFIVHKMSSRKSSYISIEKVACLLFVGRIGTWLIGGHRTPFQTYDGMQTHG